MKIILIVICFLTLTSCSATPTPAPLTASQKNVVTTYADLKNQQVNGVTKATEGEKKADAAKASIESLTPENVMQMKPALLVQIKDIRDLFTGIKGLLNVNITLIAKSEQQSDAKDSQIKTLQTEIESLKSDNTKWIRTLIGIVGGVAFLAMIASGVYLSVATNKKQALSCLGLSTIAFGMCIAALQFFYWLAWAGLGLILLGVGYAAWLLYREITDKTKGLDAVVATVDVMKKAVNPKDVTDLMHNTVTAIQQGAQDVITAARKRIANKKEQAINDNAGTKSLPRSATDGPLPTTEAGRVP